MNLNRPDQWRNPIYAAGEPGVTLVAIPRYQKPGVWCVRAAVRSEILLFFYDRRIANDRPRGARFFFSKFPIVITQRPSPFPLLFSLPFNLIYRLEQIFEQDATVRLTPVNSAGWFARVSSVSRHTNQPVVQKSARISCVTSTKVSRSFCFYD